jgi:hypothetical protein
MKCQEIAISKDIIDLFVRTILELNQNVAVDLDEEMRLIKEKKSTRTSAQRRRLMQLYQDLNSETQRG